MEYIVLLQQKTQKIGNIIMLNAFLSIAFHPLVGFFLVIALNFFIIAWVPQIAIQPNHWMNQTAMVNYMQGKK